MKRNVYLQSNHLEDVLKIIDKLLNDISYTYKKETIKVVSALNRISQEAVFANLSSPYYSASAMDGISLDAKLTYNATETNPIIISKDDFKYVNTGNEIPKEHNAIVLIEEVYKNEDESISLLKSVRPYENIRPIGEDIVEGDMIIPKNHKIRPVDISALLSGGITEINVLAKPKVAIIPTGDEIINDVSKMKKGKIIDSNSYFVKAEIELIGGAANIFSIQPDKFDVLENTILEATKNYDLIIIGASSSAGTKDFAKAIVEKNGKLLVHGISIKPGKPTIIGIINNTPIVGLPGYPVSTYISYNLFVKKILQHFLHLPIDNYEFIDARLTKKIYSSLKNREYIRVKLGLINNEFIATPLNRGAGVTMSLVKADGIMIIERNREGYFENDIVKVMLLKDVSEIKNSLISVGSHDILLDKIDNLMSDEGYHLSSSHVGSFGGVKAIKSKGCHIAPIHILGTNGTYNEFIINKYLNNSEYSLIRGVSRIQGLYVKKGNPKNIKSIKDLTREDVTFVNRQRGSGTRILLDYLLQKENIDSDKIKGYNFELATHMLVASSVKDSRFDTGMGIVSVANINNLDIIKIGVEHYDFLVLNDVMDTPMFKKFIKVLKSKEFKEEVNKLGGYIIENIGETIEIKV